MNIMNYKGYTAKIECSNDLYPLQYIYPLHLKTVAYNDGSTAAYPS
jgi:hypothetical protein